MLASINELTLASVICELAARLLARVEKNSWYTFS